MQNVHNFDVTENKFFLNSFQEDISSRVANIVKYMNMRREAGSKVDSTELLTVNLKVTKTFFCSLLLLHSYLYIRNLSISL